MADKELLLKAICGYLPYALQVRNPRLGDPDYAIGIDTETKKLQVLYNGYTDDIEKFKLYLRPMSSMTEDEFVEYSGLVKHISIGNLQANIANPESFDWLNAHHFDYRGLIEKGLALEAPERIYNLKDK